MLRTDKGYMLTLTHLMEFPLYCYFYDLQFISFLKCFDGNQCTEMPLVWTYFAMNEFMIARERITYSKVA